MRNEQRMSALGAGLLRLWAEKQITDGRKILSVDISREASGAKGSVSPGALWSMILYGPTGGLGRIGEDRDDEDPTQAFEPGARYSEAQLLRILAYFGVTLEEAEQIGAEEPGWLP